MLCRLVCGGSHVATNLSIDPALLDRALEVSGERTKKAAVTKALEEFVARRRQKRLLDLIGKLEWDKGFDYKAERAPLSLLGGRTFRLKAVGRAQLANWPDSGGSG